MIFHSIGRSWGKIRRTKSADENVVRWWYGALLLTMNKRLFASSMVDRIHKSIRKLWVSIFGCLVNSLMIKTGLFRKTAHPYSLPIALKKGLDLRLQMPWIDQHSAPRSDSDREHLWNPLLWRLQEWDYSVQQLKSDTK